MSGDGMQRSTITPEQVLQAVCQAIEALVEAAEPYDGLFPSLLDRKSCQMLKAIPPAIEGQREGDRAPLGTNLIHDQSALLTMYGLAEALGRSEYADAADQYLRRFALHCTSTETGLFPWGEHAFWNLVEDRVSSRGCNRDPDCSGSAIHDHLRHVPLLIWEKLYQFNPQCVERFCEGLDYHWVEGWPREYNRHAYIEVKKRLVRGLRSCDFPRHSGFYIFDLAFGYTRTSRSDFLQQLRRMANYWWEKRDDDGLLRMESRSPAGGKFSGVIAPSQTLSLGISLLEAASLLTEKAPGLAATMRKRGKEYLDGFLAAPHDLDRGVFLMWYRRDMPELRKSAPVWGSIYGVWPASYLGEMAICGYRLTREERLLQWAEGIAGYYLGEAFPENKQVPACDAGLALGLLADLYDITGDQLWIEGALSLSECVLATYFDGRLPRGASNIDYYDSQMGPTLLLHGLARTALLALGSKPCPLGPDYTSR